MCQVPLLVKLTPYRSNFSDHNSNGKKNHKKYIVPFNLYLRRAFLSVPFHLFLKRIMTNIFLRSVSPTQTMLQICFLMFDIKGAFHFYQQNCTQLHWHTQLEVMSIFWGILYASVPQHFLPRGTLGQ